MKVLWRYYLPKAATLLGSENKLEGVICLKLRGLEERPSGAETQTSQKGVLAGAGVSELVP